MAGSSPFLRYLSNMLNPKWSANDDWMASRVMLMDCLFVFFLRFLIIVYFVKLFSNAKGFEGKISFNPKDFKKSFFMDI